VEHHFQQNPNEKVDELPRNTNNYVTIQSNILIPEVQIHSVFSLTLIKFDMNIKNGV